MRETRTCFINLTFPRPLSVDFLMQKEGKVDINNQTILFMLGEELEVVSLEKSSSEENENKELEIIEF